MKKVIKHGNTTFQFTCRDCRCVFECDKEDYKKVIERNDKGEIVALHYYATCPECDKMNVVTKAPSM